MRRFLEPAVDPRAAAWVYFALLVSAALMVLGVSVFLLLFLAPQALVGGLGAGCHHGSFCLHALPPWAQFTLWLSVAALLGWLVFRIGWTVTVAMRGNRRMRRAIVAQARRIDTPLPHPVYEAVSSAVLACVVGIRRPLVLVSQGLRESLRAEEFEVVLGHEQAHASGRDNLLLLVSQAVEDALFFVPGAAAAHAGMRRSLEMAADAAASEGTGDDLLVASSVSHVARLLFDSSGLRSGARNLAATFADGELVVERVQRLVKGQDRAPSRRRLLLGVAVLATVLVVFGSSLYVVTGNSLSSDPGSVACAGSSASR